MGRSFAYRGDHEGTEVFGLSFPRGVPVEVPDGMVAGKLANNCDFSEVVGGVEVLAPEPVAYAGDFTDIEPVEPTEPKRRGRKPKAR